MKFGCHEISQDESDEPVGIVNVCKYCKYSTKNLNTLRSRTRCCDKNIDGIENRKKRSLNRKM